MCLVVCAIYGQWLFGISSQSQFFRIKLDGDDKSISSSYDPFNVDNPQIWAVPQEQILTYTGESDVILDTDEPGKLVSDGRYIVWAAKDGAVYYDLKFPNRGVQLLSTPVPSDPTDLDDIPKDWVDCDWIDGYFILASRNGQFFHSLLYQTQFDQLEFARTEANPDGLVGVQTLNRRVFLFGTNSVEQWFNAGRRDFAFARDNSSILNVGAASKAAIAKNETHIIFLGNNGVVYATSGGAAQPISTDSVAYDIGRSLLPKARAYTYTEENHRFYVLTLEFLNGSKKTWAFDLTTQLWHERTQTDILCIANLDIGPGINQRRSLVGKENSEHIYDQRLDWGQEDTDNAVIPIERECVSPVVYANLQRVNNYVFDIDIPKRDGDAQDELFFETEDSGRKSIPRQRKLDYGPRHRFSRLGQFYYGRRFRIQTNAKRRVDILSAHIEIDVAVD